MDKLQELLDERWPMRETDGDVFWKKTSMRDAFTQGYNAAMHEVRDFAEKHWLMSTVSYIDKTLNNGQS